MPKVSLPKYPDIEEGTLCPHDNIDHVVWKSQYGDIFICQMTDSHLKNVDKFLDRVLAHNLMMNTEAWRALSVLRGEMAIYYMEGALSDLERDYELAKIIQDKVRAVIHERNL